MEKITEEKVRAKLLKFGKKNKRNRAVAVPLLFFLMLFSRIRNYCHNNGKRLAVMVGSLFLFTVYCSFSFPVLSKEDIGAECELKNNETQNCSLTEKYDASDILQAAETIVSETAENEKTGEDSSVMEPDDVKEPPKFRSDDWRLVLINKQNSIPDDYSFQLGTIQGKMQCDKRILEDLLAMLEAAQEDGVNLTICSPYRDLEYQQMLFDRKIKRYMKRGMSYLEAYQLASQAVTVPGASEHQIGLALDIVSNDYTSLDAGFGDTEAGKWLAANSSRFGFILRYPKGREKITGIEYEPWHFRYVGQTAATVIMEQGISLEEFWEEYVEDVSID